MADEHQTGGRDGQFATLRRVGGGLLALTTLVALARLPAVLRSGDLAAFAVIPLELVPAVMLVTLVPADSRFGRPARHAAAGLLTLLLALRAAGLATHAVLGRPFLLAFDLSLVSSAVDFVTGAYGSGGVALISGLAGAGVVSAYALALLALGRLQAAVGPDRRSRRWARWPLALAAALAVAHLGGWLPAGMASARLISDEGLRDLAAQGRAGLAVLADYSTFRDGVGAPPRPPSGLGGADVLLFFLESYGRSAIEDPRYGSAVVPSLRAAEDALRRRGYEAVSGWLGSPTFGGQSWLAHSTLLSGLAIDDQVHYDLLLSSDRSTLVGDFAAAGYRTALVEPEIDRPWPKAAFYGFDRTYFARDMGYAGPRYGWITMPDQYSLAFLDRTVRPQAAGPLFATTVLVSGHAPWTPVPEVVADWSKIGDGRIFARWADRGEPPEILWRDPEKVRRQYRLAMAYVIDALGAWFGRLDDRRTLVILVGDHQAGPIVSAPDKRRDVPIHVLSNDPALLRPFRERGFVAGMVPAAEGRAAPMSGFRDRFLDSFGGGAEGQRTAAAIGVGAAAQPAAPSMP